MRKFLTYFTYMAVFLLSIIIVLVWMLIYRDQKTVYKFQYFDRQKGYLFFLWFFR
jgi:hypothetical protein